MERLIESYIDLELNRIYKLHKKETGNIFKQVGKFFKLKGIENIEKTIKFSFTSTSHSRQGTINIVEFNKEDYKNKWIATLK